MHIPVSDQRSQKILHNQTSNSVTSTSDNFTERYFYTPLLIIFLAAVISGVGWYYGDRLSQKDTEIARLQSQITQLDLERKTQGSIITKQDTPIRATQQDRDKLASYIQNRQYASLEPFLARYVTVATPGNGGIASRSQKQAISDLAVLNQASKPWNFALDDTTITDYRSGNYASFFADESLVGRSFDDYIVAMSFDSTGKVVALCIATESSSIK